MEFVRTILNDLRAWQNSPYRKPLVLQGARQVGKSWVLTQFGKLCFDNTIYVNFDAQVELRADFARTKDPKTYFADAFMDLRTKDRTATHTDYFR